MFGLENFKYNMAVVGLLQQHIKPKAELVYKVCGFVLSLHFCYKIQEEWTVDSCKVLAFLRFSCSLMSPGKLVGFARDSRLTTYFCTSS